ncbi:hypothetical protein JMJ77_0001157, partial [Colletotrichum scovillei]
GRSKAAIATGNLGEGASRGCLGEASQSSVVTIEVASSVICQSVRVAPSPVCGLSLKMHARQIARHWF